jgi:glycosyltransferase involved in cell wall biosynthesis
MSEPTLSIVAPAFNEEENISAAVESWEQAIAEEGIAAEIIITNDGSTDRTGAILTELQARYSNLRVVTNEKNTGYGRAFAVAIQASKGELVLTVDSDGQYDIYDYRLLRRTMEETGAGLVSGFRKGKKDTPARVLADRGLNLIVRVLFGLRLRDTQCPMKLARGEILRSIPIEVTGYPLPTEIVVKAMARGVKVVEEGVTHFKREGGASKLKLLRTAWLFLHFLLYLRIQLALQRANIVCVR